MQGAVSSNHVGKEKVLRLTKIEQNDPKKAYTRNSALTNLQCESLDQMTENDKFYKSMKKSSRSRKQNKK